MYLLILSVRGYTNLGTTLNIEANERVSIWQLTLAS